MNEVLIVTGHYGSGKTEFAVSLAMAKAAAGQKMALADLDIVNPYFRSRERSDIMEEKGIRVISSSLGHSTTLDLPAISAEIRGPLSDPSYHVILDLGGDQVGARAIAMFREDVLKRGYSMLLVINAYRPDTQDLQGVLRHLQAIEYTTGLKVSGLVCNTHLIWDTQLEDVLAGYRLCEEVRDHTGIPIRYVAARQEILAQLPESIEGEPLAIGMYMRDAWM